MPEQDNYQFTVEELADKWARVFAYAQGENFVLDGRRMNIRGAYNLFCEDLEEAGYSRALNSSEDHGQTALGEATSKYLAHFQGLSIETVATLLSEHNRELYQSWFIGPVQQRVFLKKAGERDLAIANRVLEKPDFESRLAWTHTQADLEKLLVNIDAKKPAVDVSKV